MITWFFCIFILMTFSLVTYQIELESEESIYLFLSDYVYNEGSKIFIDTEFTCDEANESRKKVLTCQNNGECVNKKIKLNKTHYFENALCNCPSVNTFYYKIKLKNFKFK